MKIKNTFFLILLWTSFLSSDLFEISHISNFSYFKEDLKYFFYENRVVDLDDGSSWKVHMDDQYKVLEWKIGERVYIRPRTTFYWFSRDHHFELFNKDRNEYVYVMLVYHRECPREIIDFTDIEEIVYQKNHNGTHHVSYGQGRYRQVLLVDDGTYWEIHNKFFEFLPDTTIYIGWDDKKKLPIIINGRLLDSTWTYLYPSVIKR